MAIVYRTAGAWGAGKGSPLSAPELDGNFYDLAQKLNDLLENPALPVTISTVEPVNGGFRIVLTDASIVGPFEIPALTYTWRGEWEPLTEYSQLDLFYIEDRGLFMALYDHESATEFDAFETSDSGVLYQPIIGDMSLYDIAFYAPGVVGAGLSISSPLFQMVAARRFIIPSSDGHTRGYAHLRVAASYGLSFSMQINGVEFGTIDFAAGETEGVINVPFGGILSPGSVFTILQPETSTETSSGSETPEIPSDPEDLSFTIISYRGV